MGKRAIEDLAKVVVDARWPASMATPTAAAYLDLSPTLFRKIADAGKIPAIQHTERGDRYYLREDLDAYLREVRSRAVKSPRP